MPLIDLNGLAHFKDKENAMTAADYSASSTYAVGDYAFYNGTLYRCTTEISTAEGWTSGHWTAAALADDVTTLKNALTELDTEQNAIADWIGYPLNLFDARDLAISHSGNWAINSATKTSISITHKTGYTVGFAECSLNLSSGTYVFHVTSDTPNASFSFKTNGTWVMSLTDGAEFTIDSNNTNVIYFSTSATGTFVFTNLGITEKTANGKIQTLESNVSTLTGSVSAHSANISNIESEFSDIAEDVKSELVGEETQGKAITATGTIYDAGTTHYRIVKYSVTSGEKYWIDANTNWGNLLWCFYNSSDNVVASGTASESGSAYTIITNTEVTAPSGSSYIVIAYNDTISRGFVKTITGYKIKGKWTGKKWVCVGDSLTEVNAKASKRYYEYVADETGITVVNMGVSGSGYARLSDESKAFYQRISSCPVDADVVTIFGSWNDLGAGLDLGTVTDTGTTTLAGCINTTIDNLQTVIPLVNLGIIAPTPWDTTQPSTSGNDYNYVEMLKSICEHRSIPFLDLWRCSNLRPWDNDFLQYAYSKDGGSGCHPDENGHAIIAPHFEAFLDKLLLH